MSTLDTKLPLTFLVLDPRMAKNSRKSSVSHSGHTQRLQMTKWAFRILTIADTLERASSALPGWGFWDWVENKYVQLNCDTSLAKGCAKNTTVAVTSNGNKNFGYPLITFCDIYFDPNSFRSHADAVEKIDKNENQEQLNVLNLRSQG